VNVYVRRGTVGMPVNGEIVSMDVPVTATVSL
jgi:hypothetical protein